MPDGSSAPVDFVMTESRSGGRLSLVLSGELDLAGVDQFTTRVARLEDDEDTLSVDLSGLRFIDCAGIGALVAAQRRSPAARCVLTFAPQMPSRIARVLTLTGVTGLLLGGDGRLSA